MDSARANVHLPGVVPGHARRGATLLAAAPSLVLPSGSMAHHKRKRPKHQRAGCLLCKPNKDERGKNGGGGSNGSTLTGCGGRTPQEVRAMLRERDEA